MLLLGINWVTTASNILCIARLSAFACSPQQDTGLGLILLSFPLHYDLALWEGCQMAQRWCSTVIIRYFIPCSFVIIV